MHRLHGFRLTRSVRCHKIEGMDKETLIQWERELQAEHQRTERQLTHVRALLADLIGAMAKRPITTNLNRVVGARRRHPTQNDVAADTTVSILRQLGEPVNRQILFDLVVGQGLKFGGQNPINTYGAILSRDARFVRTGMRGVWGLKEWVQRETAPVEESRPSLSSDAAVPEPVDGPALDAGGPPGSSGFDSQLRHQEG